MAGEPSSIERDPPDRLKLPDSQRVIFDAIPACSFLVDSELRILDLNRAASELLEEDVEFVLASRSGEVLQCLNSSLSPLGCGHSDACKSCLIRSSVGHATRGEKVHREKARMQLHRKGRPEYVHLSVTTTPFAFQGQIYVLLILEDISELIQLRNFLSVCTSCKRIRNAEGQWEDIVDYVNGKIDVDFSHSLCEECLGRLHTELQKA